MDLQDGNGSSNHFDTSNITGIEFSQEQIEGSGVYDPNRIPSSVFGPRPSNPGEWSVASNESLFSLHIANGSLSRENFLMLYKSGELGRLDDDPIDPNTHFHPSLPTVSEDLTQEIAIPADNLQTPSRSADSVNSTKSFAFPVLFESDEATNKSINMKKQQKATSDESRSQEQLPPKTSPKPATSSCFSCFPCLSLRHGN